MIAILLQILSIWVSQPINHTDQEIFSNSLLRNTTVVVMEEYIQENTQLRLVTEQSESDIYVYTDFIEYVRPNQEISIGTLRQKTETVGLEMSITFDFHQNNFRHKLQCSSTLDKEIRSNFLSVEESEEDFADSMLMNLIKKTIATCFEDEAETIFY
jgi:hypothetical protein